MTTKTIYICDRCGKESTAYCKGKGWKTLAQVPDPEDTAAGISTYFAESSLLCPSCSRRALEKPQIPPCVKCGKELSNTNRCWEPGIGDLCQEHYDELRRPDPFHCATCGKPFSILSGGGCFDGKNYFHFPSCPTPLREPPCFCKDKANCEWPLGDCRCYKL
jgi:DNA-directed RNA polymerase subunit RPC12/RpoP